MPFQDFVEPPDQLLALPDRGVNTSSAPASESCVPDAGSARALVSVALQEDYGRSYQRALVAGQYDGNSPYNQEKLNKQGMGWCTNLNWLGMEGRIDGARIPYYALFSGVPTYVTACCYEAQGPDKAYWEQTYAQKWTEVHDRWRQFKYEIQVQQFEMLYEGWGSAIREDDTDWRFRSVPSRSVLVPQESPACVISRIPWIAVRVPMRIHELFDKIRNEKAAAATGWDVQAVQDAIKWNTRGQNGDHPFRNQQWEVWQERYKNRELEVSFTAADLVYCDYLFVQEYSGKVSQFIFTEGSAFISEKNRQRFLYAKKHHYDSFDQVIHVCFQNTGRGSWHSVRGMAYKSFKAEAVMDRLQSRAVDNAFLSSGLTLQATDQRSKDRGQLVVNHGVTWIPPGSNNIDRNASHGQIEGVLAVARYVDAQVSQKLGNFQQQSMGRQDGRGEQPTATQVQFSAQKEASLSNGQIDNYYLDLDTLYIESNRRLLKSNDSEAKWFREQCLEAGIPLEVMMKMTVRANRVSGYGSPQMRKMALQESMAIAPMLNPKGKNNWLNEAISVIGGPDKIDLWNPPTDFPDEEDALISSENGQFRLEIQPPVIGNAVRHLVGHIEYASSYLEPMAAATEQGQPIEPEELQDAMEYLKAMIPHAGSHLEQLRGDPSEAQNYKLFTTQLKNLVGFNGKLYAEYRRIMQQQQQAAMEQQQINSIGLLDQAKMQSTQAEIERADAKAAADISLKNQKAQHQMSLKTWQADQNNKLSAAKVATDINHDRIMTAAEIQHKRMNAMNGSES